MKFKHVGAVVFGVWVAFFGVRKWEANALSNPINAGKNVTMQVKAVPQRIPATGQKCNVVITNVDVAGNCSVPVYTGFKNQLGDGGVGLTKATGQPVGCDLTKTIGTVISRDYVPDSIYVVADDVGLPDAGVIIRVEMGTGCTGT